MCIYLGDSSELTYKKQEHIFPAGLGGKQKLPNGMVSDKANEIFSPLELILMRQSPLSIDRMMIGPGKRGSLSPQKASKSRVTVDVQDDGAVILCYVSSGRPYNIPQCYLYGDKVTVSLPDKKSDTFDDFMDYKTILGKFNGNYIYLKTDKLNNEELIIGYFDNKYYVAANRNQIASEEIEEVVVKIIENFKIENINKGSHLVKHHFEIVENEEIARVYAKVAMNTLAFLKGEDYVRNKNFDDIREWIVSGESKKEHCFLPSIFTDENKNISVWFPEDSHWCLFLKNGEEIEAMVCFYNHYVRRFSMGKPLNENDFRIADGFICDWRNQKEYKMKNYIEAIAKQCHDLIIQNNE